MIILHVLAAHCIDNCINCGALEREGGGEEEEEVNRGGSGGDPSLSLQEDDLVFSPRLFQ